MTETVAGGSAADRRRRARGSLILGNMPSVMSLAAQQYYGNPRNGFWRITGDIFGFDPSSPYRNARRRCAGSGVAVWDVLRLCRRVGSLDSAIELGQHGGQRLRRVLRRASRDRSRVLQRRRGGEELPSPRRRRPAAALSQAAVDQPGADHARTRTSWRPGEKRWPLRTPAACAAPTAAPSRSARRATTASPRRMACPRVESTSAGRPRRGPTARPRRVDPSR